MEHPHEQPVRGFFFWSLAPFLLVFIIAMPLLVPKRDAAAVIVLSSIEILALFMLLGLYNPFRFWWAWRGVGAIIFLAYCVYLIAMLIESGGRIAVTPRRSEASVFNAICGLVVFGLPGLWYAVLGRLTLRHDPESDEFMEDSDEDG